MPQTKESDFNQGLAEIVRTLDLVEERPILVAVYGWPGSGKSYLMERLYENYKDSMHVIPTGGAPDVTDFFKYKEYAHHYTNSLILFHCAWNRHRADLFSKINIKSADKKDMIKECWKKRIEDPNILSEEVLGKRLNMNVGIYNPKVEGTILDGEYDLVISNPDSTRRGLCFKI